MFNKNFKREFDFNIGHLKQSPCKHCLRHSLFPGCADDCEVLDQIQNRLAQGISTAHKISPSESFTIYL